MLYEILILYIQSFNAIIQNWPFRFNFTHYTHLCFSVSNVDVSNVVQLDSFDVIHLKNRIKIKLKITLTRNHNVCMYFCYKYSGKDTWRACVGFQIRPQ
jgi:hypothetical protein